MPSNQSFNKEFDKHVCQQFNLTDFIDICLLLIYTQIFERSNLQERLREKNGKHLNR